MKRDEEKQLQIERDASLWASGALEGLTRIIEKDELGNESDSSGVDSEGENNMFNEMKKRLKEVEEDKQEDKNQNEEKDFSKEDAKTAWD